MLSLILPSISSLSSRARNRKWVATKTPVEQKATSKDPPAGKNPTEKFYAILILCKHSEAAELLAASGGLANAPFLGFSQFAVSSTGPSATGSSLENLFSDLSGDMAMILKKLSNKRDSTTKIKTAEELCAALDASSLQEVEALLPYWVSW